MLTTLLAAATLAIPSAYVADVRITDTVLNQVNPLLFGDNIEWVGNGMGVWDSKRNRPVPELVRELRKSGVTHLRYPGGTLSDYFDWSIARGENRPLQVNPYRGGRRERPNFGPDELAQLTRELNVRATITLNAGTGSPRLAAEWVAHARAQGLDVVSYCVGNEIWIVDPNNELLRDIPIAKTPEEYAEFFLATHAEVERLAPGTPLGICGMLDTGAFSLSYYPDWIRQVLSRVGRKAAFVDIHNSYAPAIRTFLPWSRFRWPDDIFARTFLAAPVYVERNFAATKRVIDEVLPGANLPLQVSEYGPLVLPADGEHVLEDLSWNRNLIAALYQASLFHVLMREPRLISANHLPLVQDHFGALIGSRQDSQGRPQWWRNIVFDVFRAYRDMAGREVLQVRVLGPTYDSVASGIVPGLQDVPVLDVSAFRRGDRVSVFLVNRSIDVAGQVNLQIGSSRSRWVSRRELYHPSYKAVNEPDAPHNVRLRRQPVPSGTVGDPIRMLVPPHSLTIVELERLR